MSYDEVLGSDKVKDALLTKTTPDVAELFATFAAHTHSGSTAAVAITVIANDAALGTGVTDGEIKITADKHRAWSWDVSETAWILIVGHKTKVKTAAYTVLANDLNGCITFSNLGAIAEVALSLPAVVAGYVGYFYVEAAQYLKIVADGTETFRYLGTQGAAGGYIRVNVIGRWVKIIGNSTEWVVAEMAGPWNYDQ